MIDRAPLSVFVTTFNNGRTLAACLESVRWADEIVVLEGGCAVERGTHAQLIKKNGFYASMYRNQHDELIADL